MIYKIWTILLLFLFIHSDIHAIVFERRKSLSDEIFEYYIVAGPLERPGIGSLITVGAIVNNIPVPWVEDGKFNLIGGFGKGKGANQFEGQDMDAYGLTIIDFPIFSNNFTGNTLEEFDKFVPPKITLRMVASKAASLYDPIGFLQPWYLGLKHLLRKIGRAYV